MNTSNSVFWTIFRSMIGCSNKEQKIQTFLEDNPILFHQFSPKIILRKAQILTKYETDFAILCENSTLLLVEIERPDKPILKKDGGRTAVLTQAFDQVHNWLHVVRNHRGSVIECLGKEMKDQHISAIRGVVIMGRDKGCNEDALNKLKSTDFGEVSLYTYDDLLRSINSLIRHLSSL